MKSDFNARIGVLRSYVCGKEGDDGHIGFNEDRLIMDTVATELRPAKNDAARHYRTGTGDTGLVQGARVEGLNVVTVTSNPFLPTDRKWEIRFNADGTVTIVLGMRDYGRGWFSAYFAGIATVRLGIPFRQVRLYYSANLPAALQTPVPSPSVFQSSDLGPIGTAVADIIHEMCDRVIERGRSTYAELADVGAIDVGFDQSIGRFFVLDRGRSGNILEIAEATRSGSSVSSKGAEKLQRDGTRSVPEPVFF